MRCGEAPAENGFQSAVSTLLLIYIGSFDIKDLISIPILHVQNHEKIFVVLCDDDGTAPSTLRDCANRLVNCV